MKPNELPKCKECGGVVRGETTISKPIDIRDVGSNVFRRLTVVRGCDCEVGGER